MWKDLLHVINTLARLFTTALFSFFFFSVESSSKNKQIVHKGDKNNYRFEIKKT
jgi:hypothetical protein